MLAPPFKYLDAFQPFIEAVVDQRYELRLARPDHEPVFMQIAHFPLLNLTDCHLLTLFTFPSFVRLREHLSMAFDREILHLRRPGRWQLEIIDFHQLHAIRWDISLRQEFYLHVE